MPPGPPTDGMAITALVLGIVAFPGICCWGLPGLILGVVAIILGRMALRRIRAAGGAIGGRGLAQAGWICGLVAAILGGIYGLFQLGFLLLGIFGAFTTGPHFTPSP
jgi:hypothetical protein